MAMSDKGGWRARVALGAEPLPVVDLDETRTALLIVDMQNYGANPDSDRGRLARQRSPGYADAYFAHLAATVIPNQQRLLGFWRRHGLRVVYLTAGAHLPDGSDLAPRRYRRDSERLVALGQQEHMHPATSDYQILDALTPRPDELVIRKNSVGAFNSSAIDQMLRNLGITGLVIVGVITEGCVETTARDAADRGYECILVEDGCASDLGRETHEASLLSFARMFGEVRTTDEVLERFAARLAQAVA
jgi:biuret amidohydrolase